MNRWQTLKSEVKFENEWLKLIHDQVIKPNGEKGTYTFSEIDPGVFIIALDSDNNIYFIEEYRYPIKKVMLQLPGGTLQSNENFEELAKHELEEETGIIAGKMEKLGEIYLDSGMSNSFGICMLATDLDTSKVGINTDDDAQINAIRKFSIQEVQKMIRENEIKCAYSLSGLNIFFQKYNENRD